MKVHEKTFAMGDDVVAEICVGYRFGGYSGKERLRNIHKKGTLAKM